MQIGHLELSRRPDALDVLDRGIRQPLDDFVLHEIIEPREHIVVLSDPGDRARVVRRSAPLRCHLDLPAACSLDPVVAEHRIVVLVDVALL